jgi:hypothetical protein
MLRYEMAILDDNRCYFTITQQIWGIVLDIFRVMLRKLYISNMIRVRSALLPEKQE